MSTSARSAAKTQPTRARAGTDLTDTQRMRPVVAASVVGTVIEWYDFFIYGTAAALVFGHLFFPDASPLAGTLAAFATYAIGFAVRPFGGAIFGHFGDRLGRKTILIATLVIMGATTTLIGLLPTYHQIGIAAPILLVVMRIAQGFGAGAEFAGAAIMAVEYSPVHRRGFFGSWPQIGVAIGLAGASGAFALAQTLPESSFMSWGWRIPFLLSSLVLLVGTWIRLRISETPVFQEIQKEKKVVRSPLAEVLRTQPKSFLVVLGLRFADNAVLYIPVTFTLSYLKSHDQLGSGVGLIGVFLASAAQVATIPLFGALSDRLGRRAVYGGGALLAAVLMVPYFWLLDTGSAPLIWLAIVLLGGLAYSAMAGSQPAFFSELFHPRVRFTGIAGARELGATIGGVTPLIATALLAAYGSGVAVAVLVIAMCAVTLAAVAWAPETRGRVFDVEAAATERTAE
ncbi:MAG: transporter, metabolite:H+ symporter family protein [Streptosporangiaceae bacterium]|nr:transporter, metabolite:H+ symporter family protein [Streptosporangiaceae bacterium]